MPTIKVYANSDSMSGFVVMIEKKSEVSDMSETVCKRKDFYFIFGSAYTHSSSVNILEEKNQ